MSPPISSVCTIMVGKSGWTIGTQSVCGKTGHYWFEPGHLEWAGVAVFKKTYKLFSERKYRVCLLSFRRISQSPALE